LIELVLSFVTLGFILARDRLVPATIMSSRVAQVSLGLECVGI